MNTILLQGICLMSICGCFWTVTGFVLGTAPRKNVSIPVMEFVMAIANLLAFGLMATLQGFPNVSLSTILWVSAVLFGSGIFNYYQHDFMSTAMLKGPNGIIWSLVQAGFIFPFTYGVIFYNQKLTWSNGFGVLSIAIALSLFGLAKDRNASGKWKTAAIMAFGCTGILQILSNTPSYYPEVVDNISSAWRALFFNAGACSGSIIRVLTSKNMKFRQLFLQNTKNKFLWFYCLGMLVLSVCNNIFISYPGMDKLAQANVGSIAYPLALAASLISFEAYTIGLLHEKRNAMQIIALALMLLGAAGLCF